VLLAVKVLPSAIVSVDPVAGVVIVTLLTVVAAAAPRIGVTSVGEVAKTAEPDPVSSVRAAARFALVGVARKVDTLVPRPDTPVPIGKPVQEVKVPDVGVPRIGVTSVGEVAKTAEPDPVSSVRAEAKLADDGVARNVATLVPRPDTPVPIGKPVQDVRVPELGVPKTGVVNDGEVARATTVPEPVVV